MPSMVPLSILSVTILLTIHAIKRRVDAGLAAAAMLLDAKYHPERYSLHDSVGQGWPKLIMLAISMGLGPTMPPGNAAADMRPSMARGPVLADEDC